MRPMMKTNTTAATKPRAIIMVKLMPERFENFISIVYRYSVWIATSYWYISTRPQWLIPMRSSRADRWSRQTTSCLIPHRRPSCRNPSYLYSIALNHQLCTMASFILLAGAARARFVSTHLGYTRFSWLNHRDWNGAGCPLAISLPHIFGSAM